MKLWFRWQTIILIVSETELKTSLKESNLDTRYQDSYLEVFNIHPTFCSTKVSRYMTASFFWAGTVSIPSHKLGLRSGAGVVL